MEQYRNERDEKDTQLTGRGWIYGLLLGGVFWFILITFWRWLI